MNFSLPFRFYFKTNNLGDIHVYNTVPSKPLMCSSVAVNSWLHSIWCGALIFASFYCKPNGEANNLPLHHSTDFNLYVCFYATKSFEYVRWNSAKMGYYTLRIYNMYGIICKTSYTKLRYTLLCVLQSTENFHQINYRVGREWTNQNQSRTENRGQQHTKRWLKNWNESYSLANDFNIMLVVLLA